MDLPGANADLPPTSALYGSGQLANVASAVRELQHPTQVGPYQIQGLIGEGGMGTVYKAEQRTPIRRTVALKLVKLGMDTRQVIHRFESERQALALMNHPNVAKVLDAGATDQGRPYFVMEYVAGEAITRFADRHKLTVRQRLELIGQACAAIQHAHQKAIIHRDLKPSNILVSMVDDKPVVKVIDFGMAKALSQRLTERTLFTETGQLVGTPEYMAPEQAESGVEDVDTRADVYSLGVVLYELLAGALPFDTKTLRSAGYHEIQRIILETDPPRPSTRLSWLGKGAEEIARLRQTPLETLTRQLRAELEWIPLRAMHKERARRYASMTELADDIQNYLADRPLRAGPESAAYRTRKFLHRHRYVVLAITGMLLLLIAGVAATTWQAYRVRAEQRRTLAQKREAELANANTQAVNEFLTQDLLRSADPAVNRGEQLTVKQALDAAAMKVGEKFKDRPLIEAAVRLSLGATYDAVGRADVGLPHVQKSLELRRAALGADHPATIDSLNQLVTVLLSLGRLGEADPLAHEALQRSRRVLGKEDLEITVALFNLGHLFHEQGKLAEAEPLYREALAIARGSFPPDHYETLRSINNMASLLQSQGRYTEAEPLFRELVAGLRRSLGNDHPDTIAGLSNFAMTLHRLERYDEAELLYREAVRSSRRVQGEEHPDTLILLFNFCALLDHSGKLDEAETVMRSTLAVSRRTVGDDHPQTIVAINNLASLLRKKGKFEEGIDLSREALERVRRVLGAEHPNTILSMNNLAHALAATGNYAEAEPLFGEVYRRAPESQIDPRTVATVMSRWGPALVELGRYDAAEAPLLEAHRRLTTTDQTQTPAMATVLEALARVCERSNRPKEAAQWRERRAALQQPASQPSGTRPAP